VFRRRESGAPESAPGEAEHLARKAAQPTARYTRAFVETFGPAVLEGPAAGLTYTPLMVDAAEDVVAKLVGAYEQELHATFAAAVAAAPDVIVNIGSGEGYWALGLGLGAPGAEVVAYDADPLREAWCRQMAEANGIAGRVDVRGFCEPEELSELVAGRRAFVLCDCEGAEGMIIDLDRAPALAGADLVIELHEWVVPDLAGILTRRLEPTHALSWIAAAPRWRDDWPRLEQVPGSDYMDHDLALNEFRPQQMRWLVARPR
jgi:hypothetical protein